VGVSVLIVVSAAPLAGQSSGGGSAATPRTAWGAPDLPFLRETMFPNSSANLHLIERFTRVDAGTLLYEVTVTDPTTWTRPWTFEVPMTLSDGRVYEYACHEGNYGLYNILSGALAAEGDAAKRDSK
jgi:hypothetical protein